MSEIRSVEDFESLLDSYEDAAYACGMDGADARDDERKARIGGRVVRAYAALRAENARLRADYTNACSTIAAMHAAAVGEVRGSTLGVVEDVATVREAASDMVREWRLHGQCTDSARPMERVLGIHAPFCPIHSGRDCECDLSRAALAPADAGKEER